MKLTRCPSCRTLVDLETDVRCFACRGDLSKAGPIAPLQRPQLLHTVRKDKQASSALLIVLAIFGVLGVLMLALNPEVSLAARIGLAAILVAGVGFGVLLPGGRRPVLKVFAAFGLLIVAGVAAVLGLLMIVFVACAMSGPMRFN